MLKSLAFVVAFLGFGVGAFSQPKTITEEQKIVQLIAYIEHLPNAKFVRNGSSYSAKEAADHLRKKYNYAKDDIKTAQQFIDQLASKSSMSGKAYTIEFADGKVITSGDLLRKKLAEIEQTNQKK